MAALVGVLCIGGLLAIVGWARYERARADDLEQSQVMLLRELSRLKHPSTWDSEL